MIPLFVGLLFGAGVFCMYWSFWPREPSAPRSSGPRLTDRMADELVQAGFEAITVRQVIVASVISFVAVLLGAYSTTRALPIAVCFAAMAGYAPRVLVGMRARRRRAQLRDLWPDAVDNIASAVRAGLALPEALAQLSVRGPEELRPAFAAFAEDYRFTGRFQESLDRLKDRLADPVADGLRARSVVPIWAACSAPCRRSFVRIPEPAPSWRPGRGGPSTPPEWRLPRRGSCSG